MPAASGKRPLSLNWLRKRMLSISPEEASFEKRGFRECDPASRQRLEKVGRTFLEGYHAALDDEDLVTLADGLGSIDAELRGFAFEGAAMGLTFLDLLSPRKKDRVVRFLKGPGADHIYMVHVGVGWALARLPWRMRRTITRLDPLLRWLVIDGYGFHEGFFHSRRSTEEHAVPRRLSGYAVRVFDQGLGRSLWFSLGADVERIPETINAFHKNRRSDLWSGVGLACTYAGGSDYDSVVRLREAAGKYWSHVAQGAAFAAKTRERARNMTDHTRMACDVLCGVNAGVAASITDSSLIELDAEGPEPDYEVWRRRIRTSFLMLNN